MIYTVTFNPALDYYMDTDILSLGETNRSKGERIAFGGKGINVSYVLRQLGFDSVALGFVGGFTGDALLEKLTACGINCNFVRLKKGDTRINVKLKADTITEINAQGPEISDEDLSKLFSIIEEIKSNDILVLSGSAPVSLPCDIYEQILRITSAKNIRAVVDASGKLLLNCLKYNPFLIKPNLAELEEICGRSLCSDDEIFNAAKSLQECGALNVLVSLGGDGACLLDETGKFQRITAHKIKPINTVGAGDSMVAGFVAGCDKGYDYALKLANAAGGATAASTALATIEQINSLL